MTHIFPLKPSGRTDHDFGQIIALSRQLQAMILFECQMIRHLADTSLLVTKITFVVTEITFKVAVIISSVVKIPFVVAEITLKVVVITSSVA